MRIKYDHTLMKYISFFETLTRVAPKDAFEDSFGLLYFVVPEGYVNKAIGKKGANAKKVSTKLNRRVRIVEYKQDRETFIKRLIFPLEVEASSDGDTVHLECEDNLTRSKIIGRNGANLRNYEDIVKRYFPLNSIKVK